VLEHLADPWSVLRRFGERLAPGGTVVASIPNIAHHTVLRDLLRGRFDYQDAGILDRTHLRFFTRRSVLRLFEDANLEVIHFDRVADRARRVTRLLDRLGRGPLHQNAWAARFGDLWTIQFLLVARRSDA
jgi:2-polyprenyl-3-methyl-5-hydroxy-6-metoxy-1,4-benzoquinol methylase